MNAVDLTRKQLETHGCGFSTVATDALVLMHLAICINCADQMFIVLELCNTEVMHL